MERLDNDRELYHEIVALFFDGLEQSITAIASAGEKGDAVGFGSAAHSIKGALGNIGAERAYKKALQMELAGKQQSVAAHATLVHELRQEIEAFREAYAQLN